MPTENLLIFFIRYKKLGFWTKTTLLLKKITKNDRNVQKKQMDLDRNGLQNWTRSKRIQISQNGNPSRIIESWKQICM